MVYKAIRCITYQSFGETCGFPVQGLPLITATFICRVVQILLGWKSLDYLKKKAANFSKKLTPIYL